LLFVFLPAIGWAQPDVLLTETLAKLKPSTKLDVSVQSGDRLLGHFVGVQEDQILLTSFEHPSRNLQADLHDIALIRQEKSGVSRGFSTGFPTGAILGGSLFTLWGLAISSLDGDTSDDTMGVIGIGVMGALAGGVALGTVGAGIGALTSAWYTIYESPGYHPDNQTESEIPEPGDTRLNLGAGLVWGFEDASSYDATGLFGQGGLMKSLGMGFELGPEIGYYNLAGSIAQSNGYSTWYTSVSPALSFGLLTTLQKREPGWQPYLVGGTGYYIAGAEYLGVSFGGGLCYRTLQKQEFKFEIRDHINVYDSGHDFYLDYFITAGAVFSFGL